MSRWNEIESDRPIQPPHEPEMVVLERQLDLVDYAECEYDAEAFEHLVLPALALRMPGLAAFQAVAAKS
jgi:hypothetical protein